MMPRMELTENAEWCNFDDQNSCEADSSVWITPALTEASKSIEVVKMESDTMVAKRTSGDLPTLELGTLRFNDLLSNEPSESLLTS